MKITGAKYYKSKQLRLAGSNYKEVLRCARGIYAVYTKRTKRNPYIRSKYFGGDKVFLNVFWTHLMQKRVNERARRLKCYGCAIDLIQNTRLKPDMRPNPNASSETLYRFYGESGDGADFYVQIKEDVKTNNKYFMSIVVPTKRRSR
jgi:hypothetical protein